MKVIRTRNVHQALPEALHQLHACGVRRDSRNGGVLMFPEPVTTVYDNPAERVMFWPEREANPFFHLFESIWMLAGRNDVESVARYVERMRSYSDDGVTFHGAYGHRWRYWFGYDQLTNIIENLKANKDDRRQVLSMWDANADLVPHDIEPPRKDLPCNLQAIFQVATDGRLDMMVTNRSNDMVWGAYGANAVHFSYLHEYVARCVGIEQGIYRQVSANFHTYESVLEQVNPLRDHVPNPFLPREYRERGLDPYATDAVKPFPLISTSLEDWHADLDMFMEEPDAMGFRDPFFRRVAIPMHKAYQAFKQKTNPDRFAEALDHLDNVAATDWKLAGVEWVERRQKKAAEARLARAQDDGVAYE